MIFVPSVLQLLEGDCIQPLQGPNFPTHPAVYRQFIYYLSSTAALKQFTYNPLTYLKQASPKPVVPMRLAVVGPPKAGKTTRELMTGLCLVARIH